MKDHEHSRTIELTSMRPLLFLGTLVFHVDLRQLLDRNVVGRLAPTIVLIQHGHPLGLEGVDGILVTHFAGFGRKGDLVADDPGRERRDGHDGGRRGRVD